MKYDIVMCFVASSLQNPAVTEYFEQQSNFVKIKTKYSMAWFLTGCT